MRCALEGHQNPARHIEFISSASAPPFARHFQGAFVDRRYPGLKPWAEIFSPFRGEIRARSVKLTRMRHRGTLSTRISKIWVFVRALKNSQLTSGKVPPI
jgi:hypothetical protein